MSEIQEPSIPYAHIHVTARRLSICYELEHSRGDKQYGFCGN